MGIQYRAWQFWRAARTQPLPPTAVSEINAHLTASERDLFDQYALSEQWHGYQVMKTLQNAGHTHPELLTAALLHDVGKAKSPITIWDRSFIVLAERLFPKKTAVWGSADLDSWKRPFVVKAHHPQWGADMAQEAGSSAAVVSLIRRHQDPPPTATTEENQLLRLLQWADNQN